MSTQETLQAIDVLSRAVEAKVEIAGGEGTQPSRGTIFTVEQRDIIAAKIMELVEDIGKQQQPLKKKIKLDGRWVEISDDDYSGAPV